MRTISITIVALVAFLFPMVASAQVIEESIGRIKDRPPCLGFFVPDGGKPIPGILLGKPDGFVFMFPEELATSITEGVEGYFCLSPLLYHGAVAGDVLDQRMVYLPIDAEKLDATNERSAVFGDYRTTKLSYMYAVVAESASVADNGNLKLNYRLFPVKPDGASFRIYNFLYTKDVPQGLYPLFGRKAEDNKIVFLGYLNVGEHSLGSIKIAYSEGEAIK